MLQLGIERHHVGAEPGARRAGTAAAARPRTGPTGACPRRARAPRSRRPGAPSRKCGSSGIESSETKPNTSRLHLARRRTAARRRARRRRRRVRSLQRRAQDLAHERHRLAPRAPAADADRHAVAELATTAAATVVRLSMSGVSPGSGPQYSNETYRFSTGGTISVTRRIVSFRRSRLPRMSASRVLRPGDGLARRARPGAARGRATGERATRARARRGARTGWRAPTPRSASAPATSSRSRSRTACEFFEACLATWKLGATAAADLGAAARDRAPRDRRARAARRSWSARRAGEYGDRPSVPAGFEPDAGALRRAAARRACRRSVRAMTSGGSTGRPEADRRSRRPRRSIPSVAENGMQPGGATLVPGPLYHAGPVHHLVAAAPLGRDASSLMTRFDAERALRADRAASRRLGALRADHDAAHLAAARRGARALRPRRRCGA